HKPAFEIHSLSRFPFILIISKRYAWNLGVTVGFSTEPEQTPNCRKRGITQPPSD
ncbi:MAG: hypothetical protein ACI91Z_001116, partial [Yoonia sp.]